MGFSSTKRKNRKVIGNCLVQYKLISDPDYPEAERFSHLIDFGSIKDPKFSTKRTIISDKDGIPEAEEVSDVTCEECTVTLTLGEQSPKEKKARIGGGTIGSSAAVPAKPETEYKQLTAEAFEALLGKGATNIVVTEIDQTTLLPAATPVTFTLDTDYKVGTKEGCTAIRRIDRGAILDPVTLVKTGNGIADDEIVKVTYTWDKPACETYTYGGQNTINYYRLRLVKQERTGNKRQVIWIWEAYSDGQDLVEFLEDNSHKKNYSKGYDEFGNEIEECKILLKNAKVDWNLIDKIVGVINSFK